MVWGWFLCNILTWTPISLSALAPQDAQEVYEVLTSTLGTPDQNRRWPILITSVHSDGAGAYYDAGQNQIVIEPKALGVCMGMGDGYLPSLAFILAHELGHFMHHDNEALASRSFRFMDSKNQFETRKALEDEADIFGLITASLSGYEMEGVVAPLMDKLYDAYEWQPESDQYPDKSERKRVLQRASQQAQSWVDMYDCGIMLLSINQPQPAGKIFYYLNQRFRSPETVYHLGLSYLLEICSSASAKDLPYALPIEIDLGYQLRDVDKGYWDELGTKRKLQRAVALFEETIGLEPEYFPGYLACATAHLLLRADADYARTISQAQRVAVQGRDQALVAILQGIYHALKGNKQTAQQRWAFATRSSQASDIQAMVSHNLHYLKNNTPKRYYDFPGFDEVATDRSIGSYKAKQLGSQLYRDKIRLEGGYEYRFGRRDKILAQGILGKVYVTLLRTQKQPLDGVLPVGSSLPSIKHYFHDQSFIRHSLRRGSLLVYPQEGVLIQLNSQDRMKSWATFFIKEA